MILVGQSTVSVIVSIRLCILRRGSNSDQSILCIIVEIRKMALMLLLSPHLNLPMAIATVPLLPEGVSHSG